MDVGTLQNILASAQGLASAALSDAMADFDTSGIASASSALSVISSQFSTIGRVEAERSQLASLNIGGGLADQALNLSINGNWTPAQAQAWAEQQQRGGNNSAA